MMCRFRHALGCALLAFAGLSLAQPAEPAYQPRSGDAWLDQHLADINLYAARYPQSFGDEMSRYYAIPRGYVEAVLSHPSWQAGDIFMACALALAVDRPCRDVVREWSRDHGDGWKGVAQRLQARPDEVQLRRTLRRSVEASYARWARPLQE
ncbi:MAG: hypothetical protein EOP91_05660 [Lysobacteraceae bacterium]|nr:MAG: hypothetical protein EOP91_05660 [Xanthomonadaceae bacterium]